MVTDNFLFTPTSQMPSAPVLAQLVPNSALESPASYGIDMSMIENSVAGFSPAFPLAPNTTGTFTGTQSVLNTGAATIN